MYNVQVKCTRDAQDLRLAFTRKRKTRAFPPLIRRRTGVVTHDGIVCLGDEHDSLTSSSRDLAQRKERERSAGSHASDRETQQGK